MENETKEYIKPTVEWMDEYYDKLNRELFGGKLGDCTFSIFTTGRGSQGKVLGQFGLQNDQIFVRRSTRRMYCRTFNGQIDIDRKNFVKYCAPSIRFNGHYTATEQALQDTLVHEMCHYYTYMNGYAPKQGHGQEFREIAGLVSLRSNGRFNIKRLADAEKMSNYQLDDEMQAKKDARAASKIERAVAIFVYKEDGAVELTLINNTNHRIPSEIRNYYERHNKLGGKAKTTEIITSSDPELIKMLYHLGYKKLMRTWRYWNVGNKDWIGAVKNYNFSYLFKEDKN